MWTRRQELLVQPDDVSVGILDRRPPAPGLLRGLVYELDATLGELCVGGFHIVDVEDEVGEAAYHGPGALENLRGHILSRLAEDQTGLRALRRKLDPAALAHGSVHLQLKAHLLGVEG